jgi:hypothetical protein
MVLSGFVRSALLAGEEIAVAALSLLSLGMVPLVSREGNKKKKKIREKISREDAKTRRWFFVMSAPCI